VKNAMTKNSESSNKREFKYSDEKKNTKYKGFQYFMN
jgi:hypothetical protein